MTGGVGRVVGLLATVALVSCSNADSSGGTLPGMSPSPGTPRTDDWAALVGGLDAPIGDRDASPCHRGDPACLEAVIGEMEVRLDELGCDHRAPFAFTYLLMTRGVAAEASTFDDPAVLSVVDARFAQQYFDAVDNWVAGRTGDVPAAWQLAFATAENGEASAAADLVLGMNAHISRDLAYIVAGLVEDADGFGDVEDETDDYARVNEVIGRVQESVLQGATDRFDPNLFLLGDVFDTEGAPDPLELIGLWRSRSFELGLELATSTSEAQRRDVEAEIERTAAAGASLVIAADNAQRSGTLDDLGTGAEFRALGPAERDAYCLEQLPE